MIVLKICNQRRPLSLTRGVAGGGEEVGTGVGATVVTGTVEPVKALSRAAAADAT